MALLIKNVLSTYKFLKEDLQDPRTANWCLVYSPITITFIVCSYLYLVNIWLPKFMENRKPFDLRRVLVIYNLAQILLSGYIVIKATPSLHTLNLSCSPVDYSNDPHAMNFAKLTWVYYMVKIVDLLDTVFFILRKKFNQASFLHIYHHFGILIVAWVGTKFIAGGESIFLGYINSCVHVVMYSYYLFAAWKPEKRETIAKWKKHVTQLQLLQFMSLFVIYLPKLFYECNFPKSVLIFIVPQNMTMVAMFGEFYYRTYIKVKPNSNQIKAKVVD